MKNGRSCADQTPFKLQLFNGDGARRPEPPTGLSDELTLRLLYERDFKLVLQAQQAAAGTYQAYEEAIHYWERLTSDPRLRDLVEREPRGRTRPVRRIFLEFMALLEQQPKRAKKIARLDAPRLSPRTVRKHCAALRTILDRSGPAGPHNREGQGILEVVPYSVLPRAAKEPPRPCLTLDDFDRLLAVTPQATLPSVRGVPPRAWWLALLILIGFTGIRIGTAMQLTWRMVQVDRLVIPARAIKRRQQGREFPLLPVVRTAILALQSAVELPPDALVFDFPDWPASQHHLQKQRRTLLQIAGITLAHNGFHSLRRRYLTEIGRLNRSAEAIAAGHMNPLTTISSYTQGFELVSDCQRTLRMPSSLPRDLLDGPTGRQQRLPFAD